MLESCVLGRQLAGIFRTCNVRNARLRLLYLINKPSYRYGKYNFTMSCYLYTLGPKVIMCRISKTCFDCKYRMYFVFKKLLVTSVCNVRNDGIEGGPKKQKGISVLPLPWSETTCTNGWRIFYMKYDTKVSDFVQ